jgi:hypothetical protein
LGGGDTVKAGDELVALAAFAHDDGDEHALQPDRAGECLNVAVVEHADVLGHADLIEAIRRSTSGTVADTSVLLWAAGPPGWRADRPATRTPIRACEHPVAGRPARRAAAVLGLQPVAIAAREQRAQLFARLADQVAFMGTSP